MDKSEKEENTLYMDFLEFKKDAIDELQADQLLKLESELAYLNEENRYIKERLNNVLTKFERRYKVPEARWLKEQRDIYFIPGSIIW